MPKRKQAPKMVTPLSPRHAAVMADMPGYLKNLKERLGGKEQISSYEYPAGRTIVDVKLLDTVECRHYGWRDVPVTLCLSDGSYLFVSRDEEGNGPGTMLVRSLRSLLLVPVIEPRFDKPLDIQQHYTGVSRLIGRNIVRAYPMVWPGWATRVVMLRLDDESKIIPMSDPEGNAPGTWFGRDRRGDFVLPNP